MTLQDLANISQILQAILVVVSLGFIWHELQEGVKLAKSESARALAEQAGAFNSLLIQNADLAKLWYSYGRNLEQEEEIARLRYREMLVQWLIFHEYIYYQWKQKLIDPELYKSWKLDLQNTVKKHNLKVFSSGIQEVFPGDFGNHLSDLQKKYQLP